MTSKKDNNGLLKPTIQITLFSILGVIWGLLSQLTVAYFFGTTLERDAYFVAISVAIYISSIFVGSFGIIFLPKVVEVIKEEGKVAGAFISTTILSVFIILVLLMLFCIIFSTQIIQIVAPGYSVSEMTFTIRLLIIVLPSIIFTVLSNMLGSLYQIKHKFIRPAIAPILTTVVSLLFVVILESKFGIISLAVGYLLGTIVSTVFLLPILDSYDFKFSFDFKKANFISYIKVLMPLLLMGIVFRSTQVIERMIASNLNQGSISYLGYSRQIFTVLGMVGSSGIVISTYPAMSKLWSEKRVAECSNLFYRIIRITLLISIPISISIILFGNLFIKIIFERGAFTSNDTMHVSMAMTWSVGAFIFQGLGGVVAKVFYITNKTILASIISTVELVIYFSLCVILSQHYSYVGLALSLSISTMLNVVFSIYYINKNIFKTKMLVLFSEIIKITVASVLSLLISYYMYFHIVVIDSITFLLVCLFMSFLTFIYLGNVLNIEELVKLRSLLLKRTMPLERK